jgi:16S rRNA (guanine527-N7)-methyltransferase
VGPLVLVAELASPLLQEGGVLVAWKGERNAREEEALAAEAAALAMATERVVPVRPYPASRNRHLHVVRKAGPTPPGLPRRPGVAAKRSRSRRRTS